MYTNNDSTVQNHEQNPTPTPCTVSSQRFDAFESILELFSQSQLALCKKQLEQNTEAVGY